MINRVCSLLCLPLIFSTFSESCLDGTAERLISGSRYRVPDQLFTASSSDNGYFPRQARLEGISWCSFRSGSARPWLQVTFGIDVNISIIQTGGFSNDFHVNSFQVYIGDTEGSLHPLISDDSMEPIVFLRKRTFGVENTTLPSPVTTQVLHIVPFKWKPMSGSACLRLEALGCPISQVCVAQQLLTNDEELLDSIVGSSSIPSGSLINNLVSTTRWCTRRNLGDDPYFQLNFTSTVSLTYLQARGTFNGYVQKFSLEVQDGSGNFSVYRSTSEPTIFTASGSALETFTFWKPIQGNTFRLHILKFRRDNNGFVCWNTNLYGCITNTGTAPPTVSITTTEATPTVPITTTEPSTEAPSLTPQGQSRAVILGGVVGGILGLLLLLLVIVVAVILILTRRKSQQVQLSESFENSAEHNFDNSIYGQEPALSHLYDAVPGSTSGETNRERDSARPEIASTSNVYETIPTTTSGFHLTKDLNGGTMDREAYDNPIYAENIS